MTVKLAGKVSAHWPKTRMLPSDVNVNDRSGTMGRRRRDRPTGTIAGSARQTAAVDASEGRRLPSALVLGCHGTREGVV